MTVTLYATGPLAQLTSEEREHLLQRSNTVPQRIHDAVEEIKTSIQTDGDAALKRFTQRFDDAHLDELTVPTNTLDEALEQAPPRFQDAFETCANQIQAYHETFTQRENARFHHNGIQAHERTVPVERAGIYVPGGTAPYPSTVAMTVIPAKTAGVKDITVATPPQPNGTPPPLTLAACRILNVDRVVPLGGAQAIFALALGTETIPQHPVIVGPGNAYVQAAKQQIAGQVRIDAPAGPSEIAILLGPQANPRRGALEMAAQAEHAPNTQPLLLAPNEELAQRVHEALETLLHDLERNDTIHEALATNGAILTYDDLHEAETFLNELAPEHCILLHEDAENLANTLQGPACIAHGPHASIPLTDYGAGPSHVLPTGRAARAYSGINLDTFTKKAHIVHAQDPPKTLTNAAATLARYEGLTAHARTIEENR